MNVSLNIYDLFASTIPGSLYLLLTIYLGVRFGWIEVSDLADLNTTFALVGAFVASYLLGVVLGYNLRWLVERSHIWGTSMEALCEDFRRRNPSIADRPFVEADPFTLLAGLRQHSQEAAQEVDRARANSIMLQASSMAFLIGTAVALVEVVVAGPFPALAAAAGLGVMTVLALYEGQRRGRWARMHTFECAVWMPDVEARLGLAPPP